MVEVCDGVKGVIATRAGLFSIPAKLERENGLVASLGNDQDQFTGEPGHKIPAREI